MCEGERNSQFQTVFYNHDIICPKCGNIVIYLSRFPLDKSTTISCKNESCELYNKKFIANEPKVILLARGE
jgi:hypothetical protein